ncbi:MAG: hypothetical protein ACLFQ6_01570 [Candidatus Sumerlaeia bacterium]
MNRRTLFLMFVILVSTVWTGLVFAQKTSPADKEDDLVFHSVEWVKSSEAKPDEGVAVQAKIVTILDDDAIIVKDSRGAIVLRTKKGIPQKLGLEAGQMIQVIGTKILNDDGQPEIRADNIQRYIDADMPETDAPQSQNPTPAEARIPVPDRIAFVLKNAKEEEMVMVEGTITEIKEEDTFIIRDETEKIKIKADQDVFYRLAMEVGMQIQVRGIYRDPLFYSPRLIARQIILAGNIPGDDDAMEREVSITVPGADFSMEEDEGPVKMEKPAEEDKTSNLPETDDGNQEEFYSESYVPESHSKIRPIKWANEEVKDKQMVTVQGRITEILGKGKHKGTGRYRLKDASGDMELFASPKVFYKLGLSVGDTVTVTGEMDRHWIYTDKLIGLYITKNSDVPD